MLGKRQQLHRAYERFIAGAAAAGLVAGEGLTPREQRDRLVPADVLPAEELHRLVELLERCVYQGLGTPEELDEGLALCGRLTAALPPPLEVDRAASETIWQRLAAMAQHLALPSIVVVIVVLAVLGVIRGGGITSLSVSVPALDVGSSAPWSHGLDAEIGEIGTSSGSWKTPASNATFQRLVPGTLQEPSGWQVEPDLDLTTGVDGYVDGADPFEPPLAWTHRRIVYTGVSAGYGTVRAPVDPARDARGDGHRASHRWRATVKVRIQANRPIPIPSPAPDTVVTSYTSSPPMSLRFIKDTGDGLHVIGAASRTVTLQYDCATWDDYWFAPLSTAPFQPAPIPMPAHVRADAEQVLAAIGEVPAPTFERTVRRLHSYFAGFSVAPIAASDQRENSYLTVALSRKGVCRHRARAFFITANAAGVPTRLVENRAHSFVEVRQPDGSWRRLEFRLDGSSGSDLDSLKASLDGPSGSGSLLPGGWTSDLDTPEFWLAIGVGWLFVVSMGVLALHFRRQVSAHVLTTGPPDPRPEVRARRDLDRGMSPEAAAPLTTVVRMRLARRLGIDSVEPAALLAASRQADLPPKIQHRIERLLLDEHADGDQATRLEHIYWDSQHLLRWLSQQTR